MSAMQRKILVVEDETIVAEHIAESLKQTGYEVTDTVTSGKQAVESVKNNRPDLVLMDIILQKNECGIDAAATIYSQSDIPVIFLTAYSDKTTLDRAKTVGPFGYIIKPFREKDLHSSIQVALNKFHQEGELRKRKKLLATLIRRMSEPVIIVDRKGTVSYFNIAAETLSGLKMAVVKGQSIDHLLAPKENDVLPKVTEFLGKEPSDCGLHRLTPFILLGKNEKIPVQVNISLLQDVEEGETGEPLGGILVLHPLTQNGEARTDPGASLAATEWYSCKSKKDPLTELCPWCKNILKKNENRWVAVEEFVRDVVPELNLIHCICQKCAQQLGLFDPEKISDNERLA